MYSNYMDSLSNFDIEIIEETIEENDIDDDFRLNNLHTNTGYDNHSNSGYDNYSEGGCNTHYDCSVTCTDGHGNTNTGYDNVCYIYKDTCGVNYYQTTGCSTHDDHNDYSEGYPCSDAGYNNHTNTGCETHSDSGCNTHSNYTNNYNPILTGVIAGNGSTTYNATIPLTWPVATHNNTAPGGQTVTYYLFYKYKAPLDSAYGAWKVPAIASTTGTSYIWNIQAMPAGNYIVKVRAWDGQEWDDATTTPPASLTSATVTGGLDSAALVVVHYQAPSWPNVITDNDLLLRKQDLDITRTEVNKAKVAFGLTAGAFTDPTITTGTTKVAPVHITQIRTGAQQARTAAGKGTWTWTQPTLTSQTTPVKGAEIRDVQRLLEDM